MQELVSKCCLSSSFSGQLVRDIDQLAKERKESMRGDKKTLTAGGCRTGRPSRNRYGQTRSHIPGGLEEISAARNWPEILPTSWPDQRHDYDEAERYYRKALELDPSHAAHTGNFANFWQASATTYDKAEHYYRKALELGPTIPTPQPTFAHLRLLRRQGDDLAQLPAMLAQVITLAKGQASQILAEALFYGVLSQALGQHFAHALSCAAQAPVGAELPARRLGLHPALRRRVARHRPRTSAAHYRALGRRFWMRRRCRRWGFAVVAGCARGGSVYAAGGRSTAERIRRVVRLAGCVASDQGAPPWSGIGGAALWVDLRRQPLLCQPPWPSGRYSTIVQVAGAALPELHALRGDGKAAPVRRARHMGEALRGKAGKARHHHFFAADRLALLGCPGTHPAL